MSIYVVEAVEAHPFKQMSRSSSPQADDLSPASSASSPGRRPTCAPLLGHEASGAIVQPTPFGAFLKALCFLGCFLSSCCLSTTHANQDGFSGLPPHFVLNKKEPSPQQMAVTAQVIGAYLPVGKTPITRQRLLLP